MGRLLEMETSVRVVATGSFSAAARDLKIGQPAISKTIAGLEDRLGVRLLLDAHPRLRLEVVMDDRAIDLVAENIDAALRLGSLTDSALVPRKRSLLPDGEMASVYNQAQGLARCHR